MFEEMDVATGIDLDALVGVSLDVGKVLGVAVSSYAARGGTKAEATRFGQLSP